MNHKNRFSIQFFGQHQIDSKEYFEVGIMGIFGNKKDKNKPAAMKLIDIVITDGTTEIGKSAFQGREDIRTILVPDSVEDIQVFAFTNCTHLETIRISNRVTYLANELFWGCESLREVILPDNLEQIGNRVFGLCSSLREIYIPDSVVHFGYSIFMSCSGDLTICCSNGSKAEQYAKENDIKIRYVS